MTAVSSFERDGIARALATAPAFRGADHRTLLDAADAAAAVLSAARQYDDRVRAAARAHLDAHVHGHRMVDTPDGFLVCERCGAELTEAAAVPCRPA